MSGGVPGLKALSETQARAVLALHCQADTF